MSVLGVVVEYNPFHLGHLHHLQEAKRLTQPEATVAVISGCFTQRGEPALVDKWARAEMALEAGVDLVIELPVASAVRSAAYFAAGATSILAAAGATTVCFGSEIGSLAPLEEAAQILLTEPPAFRQALRAALAAGRPFAAAQDCGLRAVAPHLPESLLRQPNNRLGIEYLQAIMRHNLPLKASTIRRSNNYHSLDVAAAVPSARAIRQAVLQGEPAFGMPRFAVDILQRACAAGHGPVSWADLEQPLIYQLRSLPESVLAAYPEAAEGLGRRLWQAAREHGSLQQVIRATKTRRFALTRVQRLLTYVLLQLATDQLNQFTSHPAPYLRVLALNRSNQTARKLLQQAAAPVVFSPTAAQQLPAPAAASLELDSRAVDCYTLAWQRDSLAGWDYRMPVVVR
ncbi:MAG: nucleotidyltransferase family protein [Bacillota bacterium]